MEKITIAAEIAANDQKVWDYWTQPQHIVNWNFASPDWHCPKAENDVRTGGKFSSVMASRDGKMSFEFGGVYDEVVNGKKIAYTMGDGRKVETVFENLNGKTRVTTHFDPENTNPIEMQKGGWQAILNNFKEYVETK